MNKVLQYIPEAQDQEFFYLEKLFEQMDEEQMNNFSVIYRSRRKDTQTTLILALLGLVVVAGLQRFYVGQIGWGIAYLFTGGFCLVGTIMDLINHKELAFECNQKIAEEVAQMI
jgi:TM2 domain-containing membrane protein YozV